jgi:3-deoxy-manno-octulosonate cytidylyltransferase (CMP-KDO synthetase)
MKMGQEVLIVIPARLKSNRLNEKLLRTIDEKPVIIHVCDRVSKCADHADFIVATDAQIILDHVEGAGYKCIMTSIDHTCGTERCAEVANRYPEVRWIVNVQGDEPFIDHNDIIALISCLKSEEVSIASLYHNLDKSGYKDPNTVKVFMDEQNVALDFLRICKKVPRTYQHIGVYGFKSEVLQQVVTLEKSSLEIDRKLEQMRWLENGFKIKMVNAKSKSISIDTAEDLQKARSYWLSLNKTK